MSSRTYLFLAASLLFGTFAFAQGQKTLYVEDILAEAQEVKGTFVVKDANIIHRPVSGLRSRPQYHVGQLEFEHCIFDDIVSLDSLTATQVLIRNCTGDILVFMEANIETIEVHDSQFNNLAFSTHHIDDTLRATRIGVIYVFSSAIKKFTGQQSEFDYVSISAASIEMDQCRVGSLQCIGLSEDLKISDCDYHDLDISGSLERFIVEGTRFRNELRLSNVNVSGVMKIASTRFDRYLTFGDVAASSENVDVNFRQVANGKLRVASAHQEYYAALGALVNQFDFITTDSLTLTMPESVNRFPATDSAYFHSSMFEALVYNYQRLFSSYRARGDIESANACYIEMKEIERARLKFRHNEEGSFKSYFRFQLANLLKVYTDHGTDPAKAIVASMWVLLIFAVFYFFFPSDWDTTSKGRLIKNYRDFIEKNDKGYAKPFLRLIAGFALSFVNALTLSLNSFTTLGFGNIPTHGIARYVCVLQGFIGWFLLSIFTVALINQALF